MTNKHTVRFPNEGESGCRNQTVQPQRSPWPEVTLNRREKAAPWETSKTEKP